MVTDQDRLPDLAALKDPIKFLAFMWPDVVFYRQQRLILESVDRDDETVVVAGNMLGKDWVAGAAAISYFLRKKVVRVVSTSVKDDHLRVLWGEIGRFIQTSRWPLTVDKGGPIVWNHRDLRKVIKPSESKHGKGMADLNERVCHISYCRGMVSERGEGLAGHHAAHTLAIIDEASGVDDHCYTQMATWAKRMLIFGNPNPSNGFFYKAVEGGDILAGNNSNLARSL